MVFARRWLAARPSYGLRSPPARCARLARSLARNLLSQLRSGKLTVAPLYGCAARSRIEQRARLGSIALERERCAAQPVAVHSRPGGAVFLRIEQRFGAVEMRERVSGIAGLHVVARQREVHPRVARVDLERALVAALRARCVALLVRIEPVQHEALARAELVVAARRGLGDARRARAPKRGAAPRDQN